MQREGIDRNFCIIIADCCREPIEPEESKGQDQDYKKMGSMTIFTCPEGETAKANKNQPSAFSKNIREHFSKFHTDYDSDLIKFLESMASKTDDSVCQKKGLAPKGIFFGEPAVKKECLRDILQSIGDGFEKYEDIFRLNNITKRSKFPGLTDYDLHRDFKFKGSVIKQWRKEHPYPEGTWQRMFYENKYGPTVLKFELQTVESMDDIR
eukprot:UN02868